MYCCLWGRMPMQQHVCCRYNNLQTGFMSTAPQACLLAKEAGMQILPLVHISETHGKPVQKGLSGWPPPSVMAQTIMTVLGEHRACCLQVSSLSELQGLIPAGFDEDAPDGSSCSQAFMAASDDDATDLLFLHVAWDNTCSGKGCSTSELLQPSCQHSLVAANASGQGLATDAAGLLTCITGNMQAAVQHCITGLMRY